MKARFTLVSFIVATAGLGCHAASREQTAAPTPTRLGAASNFSQGWNADTGQSALDLPLRRIRDSIRWQDVERNPGTYNFDKPATTWPDHVTDSGTRITLTLNWGNPLYDNGDTPHSPEALAAFGRFAAAVVKRFPQIDTLEIGNEINSANFVSGTVKDAGIAERGQYHLAMMRAAAEAVHAVRPNVVVLGGATHSLPAGFLWPLLDLPGAGAIQGLAVHPYTTPIDQLPAQIGFLRRHRLAAGLPLYVTEFGSQNPQRAADDLMRGYATLATLGTAEIDWYPFNDRGDGLVPLIMRDGSITGAGKAFRFIQSRLSRLAARDASPDPFTIVRSFGPNIEVMWGAKRMVSVDPGKVSIYDATGIRVDPEDLVLSEDRAFLLVGSEPLDSGTLVRFGCQALIADSFYQFGYPLDGASQAPEATFARFVSSGGRELPFQVLPGQQRAGVPWTPYLGRADMSNVRLMADTMLPATGPGGAIVHRYAVAHDGRLHLAAEFTPSSDSADGITVEAAQDGQVIVSRSGTAPVNIDLHMKVRKGQSLTLAVGPGGNARGDTTRYRIRIFDEDRCEKTNMAF